MKNKESVAKRHWKTVIIAGTLSAIGGAGYRYSSMAQEERNETRALIFGALTGAVGALGASMWTFEETNRSKKNAAPTKKQVDKSKSESKPKFKEDTEVKEGEFVQLAKRIKKFAAEMDEDNRIRFMKIITLLETNLEGIEIIRFVDSGDKKYLAQTIVDGGYKNTVYKLRLNDSWDINNNYHVAILIHELMHIVESKENKVILSREDWLKRYYMPGNMVEISYELTAWEIQLVLIDKLSGGLFEAYVRDLYSIPFEDKDSLKRTLTKYTDLIAEILNANGLDQKKNIWNWLTYFDAYRYAELHGEKIGTKWTYNFATKIAGEYLKLGQLPYQIDLPPDVRYPDDNICLYPLGSGPYTTYRQYNFRADMVAVPSEKPVNF